MHTSVNDEMLAMMERYENNIVLISSYWQDKYYIRLIYRYIDTVYFE